VTAYQFATGANSTDGASKQAIRARLVLSLAVLDFCAISLGMVVVALVYLGEIDHKRLVIFLPLLLPVYYLFAARQHAFRLNVVINAGRSMGRCGLAFTFAIAAVILALFFLKASDELSRGLALAGGAVSVALLLVGRALFASYAYRKLDGQPQSEIVLVDGFAPPPICNAPKIDVAQLGLRPDINEPDMLDRLGKIIHGVDRVIISCEPSSRAAWALALRGAGINVEVLAPELDEIGAITHNRYHGTATALIASGPLTPVDRFMKRCLDLAFAVPAAIVLSPFIALVAAAIKLDSRGPVLFKQKRIGMGNRLFPMYKFRSMYTDRLDHNASKLTTRNDSRVTRVGKIIRATSIDELPQLLNVIRGDMSIVGPRPHATGALAGDALYWEVATHYWSRHAVKPGLTGLAQVKGFRGNTETSLDLMNRLQADLDYLEEWSLARDISLIFKTFSVLIHKNAF